MKEEVHSQKLLEDRHQQPGGGGALMKMGRAKHGKRTILTRKFLLLTQ